LSHDVAPPLTESPQVGAELALVRQSSTPAGRREHELLDDTEEVRSAKNA